MSYTAAIEVSRHERDLFFKEHYASPLPEEEQETFVGIDYFPIDPSWRMEVKFNRQEPSKIDISSTSGMDSAYTTVGSAVATIGGSTYVLVVLDDGDGDVFVPFRDGTCGAESYAGGRYVTVEFENDGRSFLDFNVARNPWCVYDDEFVCPLPPATNWITEPISAGERMYLPG